MTNVVEFPKSRSVNAEQPIEKIKENVDAVKRAHVDETVNLMGHIIFENLSATGFEFFENGSKRYVKDISFLMEAMRSLLNKYHKLEHPIQIISEDFLEVRKDGSIVFSTKETN